MRGDRIAAGRLRALLAVSWLVLGVAGLLVAGCRDRRGDAPVTEYRDVPLGAAPVELQAQFERFKAAPGLLVLEQGQQSYLLITAGRVEEPGLTVEVFSAQELPGRNGEVRLLARLREDGGESHYPHAVVVLEGRLRRTYRVRLTTREERVLDLPGLTIDER